MTGGSSKFRLDLSGWGELYIYPTITTRGGRTTEHGNWLTLEPAGE